ncbi:lipid II:glycine glycyltransferase FemX [Arthrobacter antibioticus]|uniref:lipid II:glycine glycyltransferase FemX n=1 Tax=Arthrobacter sp. H35-MC1 TaxID=3046203 RepID=UPI0024B9ADFE|nr:peptidoglycan bridge formation glycyltransferase FemA/FemB family protein [Arthrobacter sp. H35-MC1]MDJ0317463.1 peptidoglycan bridge formation glycyltransferase FemA/FemB family protein [Arthrobacter sp. H35-MC1]
MPEFTARFATAAEIEQWDTLVTANPNGGNLLQSEAFAAVKKNYGWDTQFLAFEGPHYTSYNLVLEKSFPVLGKLWYLIKGPDVADVFEVPAVLEALRVFVKRAKLHVFAVKIEPDIVASEEAHSVLRGAGLVKVPDLQPNDSTALLDISPESSELLRKLHSRGRNAVRRAIRENVEVVRMDPTESTMRTMYSLMVGTIAAKATTQARDFEYYRQFWTEFTQREQGHFYFVFEDGVASVGAFVINYGAKATYKDGGSLQKRSQYGDSHLVQWAAINDMKELGALEYDFCGTPPADRLKDPTHPHHGLGLFKTSFSKTVTDFVGCYDLVLSPVRYKLWSRAGERVFRQLYTRRTGKQFY